MKALVKLNQRDIRDIQKIEKLFKKLKANGVEWEGIDGGGGGTIKFFKPKSGLDVLGLDDSFEGRGPESKFANMLYYEQDSAYDSSINIGIVVP